MPAPFSLSLRSIGIVETLGLSVYERTREIGLLCALGVLAAILPAHRAGLACTGE